jgi:hypothetical protein
MLDEGVYMSVSEIGDAENISKSCEPDPAVGAAGALPRRVILAGRTDQALMLGRLERLLPAVWEAQCRLLGRLW